MKLYKLGARLERYIKQSISFQHCKETYTHIYISTIFIMKSCTYFTPVSSKTRSTDTMVCCGTFASATIQTCVSVAGIYCCNISFKKQCLVYCTKK